MFFKMLKNDLKAHKGLNIILFFFIISASIISVVAANLMYMELVGRGRTDKICNIANIVVNINTGMGRMEEKEQLLIDWMEQSSMVEEGELKEFIKIGDGEFSVNGVFASDDSFPYHKSLHLTTASSRVNLLYNDEDKRFSLESGSIAISYNLSDIAGIKKGDEIRITSQLGRIYSFTVAQIYKTPFDMGCEEVIISGPDFERMKADEPLRTVKLILKAGSIGYAKRIQYDMYEMTLDDEPALFAANTYEYTPEIDPDYTVLVVISYFLMVMSIMIIIIMLITIRYMMMAAIKQEEKEIGMMRAIGVDSFRYRWMFAATYITFAVIGGIAGITAGEPLARYILKKFCANMITRDRFMVQKTGLVVSISLVVLIIAFSAVMMRRIRKISIVEAIHGKNIGERFDKFNRVDLYRSKKCKVPPFLALADMANSFAKYSFLIISYMLAATILLTVFNIKSTVLSPEYQKCFLRPERDFIFYISGELADYYYQKGGDYEGAINAFVEDVNNEGIAMSVRYMKGAAANLIMVGKDDIGCRLWFGDTYNEGFKLKKGSKLPIHANEVAMSYFTARKEGFKIGDTITLELDEFDDDHIAYHTVQREFIITGFFDMMEEGYPELIAGREYSGAVDSSLNMTNIHLDAPKSEHPAIIQQLKDRFGEQYIDSFDESVKSNFRYITNTVDALKLIFIVIVAFIMALNTTLYTTVDLSSETPGIAMLKCVGFSNKDIRKWQMIRMVMILVISILLGYVLEFIGADLLAGRVFEIFGNTGVHLVPDLLENFVIIPAIIMVIGVVIMRICLMKVKSINLWNIREE